MDSNQSIVGILLTQYLIQAELAGKRAAIYTDELCLKNMTNMYRMLEKEIQAAAPSTAACSFIFRNVFYKLRYNIKINCFIYFIKACVSALLFQCLYYIMNKYKSFGCISKLQLYTRYQVGITGGRNYL